MDEWVGWVGGKHIFILRFICLLVKDVVYGFMWMNLYRMIEI